MDRRNVYYVELSLPALANPKYRDLTAKEFDNCGRIIGGDKGDVHFKGYTLEDGKTILDAPILLTTLDLNPDEAQNIAEIVLQESFESIGVECVEHS